MPEPDLAYWRRRIHEHSSGAGTALSDDVLDELAAYVADVYFVERERGASAAAALSHAQAILERARYEDLTGCRRAVTPPASRTREDRSPVSSRWFAGLGSDVRDAWRGVRRQPAFTMTVAAILALGVGATTAAYVIIDAVLLRPLPYPNADQLIVLTHVTPREEGRAFATADWIDYRTKNADAADLATFASWPMNITGGAEPERLRSVIVSGNFFAVIGQPAALGRAIEPADDDPSATAIAVLGDGFWRRRFGADPAALGSSVIVNGRPVTVVGVMAPRFAIPDRDIDLWMPMSLPAEVLNDRRSEWVSVIGRVRPDLSLASAQSALAVTAAALARAYPATNAGEGVRVSTMVEEIVGRLRTPLWLGGFAALLVLMASCANATNLLVGRAAMRRDEMAIRASLGARPLRLVRQLFVESTMLALAGGALGVGAAALFLRGFVVLGEGRVPRLDQVDVLGPPLAIAVGTSMIIALACVACGDGLIVRAIVRRRLAMSAAARVTSRHDGRWSLAVQVAFALILLTATATVAGRYAATIEIDPGFDTTDTLTLQLTLGRNRYPDNGAHIRFAERLSAALATLPGVTSAGVVSDLPFVANALHFQVREEGTPQDSAEQMTLRPADAGFFRALRIPVREGRVFTDTDRADAPPVALVNESAARRLSGARVGARLQVANEPARTVVGVIGDIRHSGLQAEEGPVVYVPYAQKSFDFLNWMGVVVRGPGAEQAASAVRAVVHELDSDQPIQAVRSMADYVARERAPLEFSALVIGALAAAALLITLAGIHGVTALVVSQRLRDLGVRRALGASKSAIVLLVLGRVGRPVLVGAAFGIAGAIAGGGMLRATLAASPPATSRALIVSVAMLLATALVAALRPALHGGNVDARTAMQSE